MFTVEMEIKNPNSPNSDYYVPSTKDFKKYPRTVKGIATAIEALCKNLKRNDITITDFNIIVYQGKVHYYTKNKNILFKLDNNLSEIM